MCTNQNKKFSTSALVSVCMVIYAMLSMFSFRHCVFVVQLMSYTSYTKDYIRAENKLQSIAYSTPTYLSDVLHLYSPSQSLRSSADTCLPKLPRYKCKMKDDRAFSYSGPSVGNSLPLHIRNVTTINTFKFGLKTHLFNLQDFDKLVLFGVCVCVHVCVHVCVAFVS